MNIAVLGKDELNLLLTEAARQGAEYALSKFSMNAASDQPLWVSIPETCKMLGVSRSKLTTLRGTDPTFPEPMIPPGAARPKWRLKDIETYASGQRKAKK
jgi:predicted DNA-binding transcriptional regulator AlpA